MDRYDLRHIAGYCSELTIWNVLGTILADLKQPIALKPENVCIVNDALLLTVSDNACTQSECVWSIGALINFLSSGRQPFGGRGIEYHKANPDAQLPILRSEHRKLQDLMHRCLKAEPDSAMTLDKLRSMVSEGKETCRRISATRVKSSQSSNTINNAYDTDSDWPERMIQ